MSIFDILGLFVEKVKEFVEGLLVREVSNVVLWLNLVSGIIICVLCFIFFCIVVSGFTILVSGKVVVIIWVPFLDGSVVTNELFGILLIDIDVSRLFIEEVLLV